MSASTPFEPRIVGIFCNWCSYAGADMAGAGRMHHAPNVRIVRVMCSGRVEPTIILEAFRRGADGVLIAGCHPGDCHYLEGNHRAMKRTALLRKILPAYGIDPRRVRLEWISASEGARVASIIDEMTGEIRALGPAAILRAPADAAAASAAGGVRE